MSYLGEEIKKLGFGMMRLPNDNGVIDIEKTKAMVDYYIEQGFTYFDTAFIYNGSEEAVRKSLVERYPRESYQLANKNAAWWNCKTREEAIKQFEISLERTKAGYFDFYLLHNLGEKRTELFDEFNLWNWALELKEKGLIKHLGFSFHSNAKELDQILTKHPEAEFVQLQINYLDWESANVQSRKCYEVARKHNKPIIIMEPVKGGMLANPPKSVEKIMKDAEPESSVASWAIRFAAGLEGVITVLSGMSTMEQVKDNTSYMKDFSGLNAKQEEVINDVLNELNKIPLIQCTGCDYCGKICPKNIGIPGTFSAYNFYVQYNDKEFASGKLKEMVENQKKSNADECIKCGKCEEVCPQKLKIRDLLVKTKF